MAKREARRRRLGASEVSGGSGSTSVTSLEVDPTDGPTRLEHATAEAGHAPAVSQAEGEARDACTPGDLHRAELAAGIGPLRSLQPVAARDPRRVGAEC